MTLPFDAMSEKIVARLCLDAKGKFTIGESSQQVLGVLSVINADLLIILSLNVPLGIFLSRGH